MQPITYTPNIPNVFVVLTSCVVLSLFGCSPSGAESRKLGFTMKSSASKDSGANINGDGDTSKSDGGQESVQVAGAGLVPLNIDNGLTRCAFVDLKNSVYDVNCYAVIVSSSGAEYKATSLQAGVKINWDLPKSIAGSSITTSACKIDPSGLSQSCEVTLSTPVATQVQTNMNIVDTTSKRSKVTSDVVVLSISISVYGLNINAPMSFQVDSNASSSTIGQVLSSAPKDQLFGYQPMLFDPLRTNFVGISKNASYQDNQVAICGSRAYFTAGAFIFVMDTSLKGAANTWLYAGSALTSNVDNLAHRLTHAFGEISSVVCGKDNGELYVVEKVITPTSSNNWRILHIFENGPVGRVNSPQHAGYSGRQAIALDSKGNLWVADTDYAQVVYVDPKGVITKVAGTGEHSNKGDGGPAINAAVNEPARIAVGPDDSVYICNKVYIRKIDSKGIITTIAGTATAPKSGADLSLAVNYKFGAPLGINGPIFGMASSPDGSLYVTEADIYLHSFARILKISTDGKISIIAGSTSSGFSGDAGLAAEAKLDCPNGIATTSDGSVVFVDNCNGRVRSIDKKGIINTIAGDGGIKFAGDGGPANSALLTRPEGMVIAKDGSVIFSDMYNHRVRKIDLNGTMSTILDGAQVTFPRGLASSEADGSLFVSSYAVILKVDAKGVVSTIAGCGTNPSCGVKAPFDGTQKAKDVYLTQPADIVLMSDGSIVFVDLATAFVHRIDPQGMIKSIAGSTTPNTPTPTNIALQTQLNRPQGLLPLNDGSILIFDTDANLIRKWKKDGSIETIAGGNANYAPGDAVGVEGGLATDVLLNVPKSGVLLPDGRIYFTETGSGTSVLNKGGIRILTPDPNRPNTYTISTLIGNQTGGVCGGGVIQKKVTADQVQQAIQASLSTVCVASPSVIAIRDNCAATSDPSILIAFGQSSMSDPMNAGSTVTVMKQSCPAK